MRRLIAWSAIRRRRPRRRGGSDRGFILIVVISVLGLLALVAAVFARVTSSHVRAAAGAVQGAKAEALADAGANIVIRELVDGWPRLPRDGTPFVCDGGVGLLVLSVQDEAGKVDLNMADERLLRSLFAGVGIPASQAAADALLDFRDPDSDRRPQGAEKGEYLSAGRIAGPKNAPLVVVDELEQVLGISAADVSALRPHVTVSSGQSAIAARTATQALVEILRRGEGRIGEAPKQDAEEQFAGLTIDAGDPTEADGAHTRGLPPGFVGGAGRRVFSVYAEARVAGAVFVREAIVELGTARSRPFILQRWHRGLLRIWGTEIVERGIPPPC